MKNLAQLMIHARIAIAGALQLLLLRAAGETLKQRALVFTMKKKGEMSKAKKKASAEQLSVCILLTSAPVEFEQKKTATAFSSSGGKRQQNLSSGAAF